jgi:hypothetical protein
MPAGKPITPIGCNGCGRIKFASDSGNVSPRFTARSTPTTIIAVAARRVGMPGMISNGTYISDIIPVMRVHHDHKPERNIQRRQDEFLEFESVVS